MVKKIDIGEVFSGLQEQMRSKLSLSRRILTHPTTKGDVTELEWIEMLSSYLPERYSVNKAFVVDFEGRISDQIDIVIFDRHYSPFILKQNGALYIPAECVYAIIEVKQVLNNSTVKYASKKAQSVRNLKRTSAKITQADGKEYVPRVPPKILAGILTLNGSLRPPLITKISKLSEKETLNFGCSLTGAFFCIKDFSPWGKNMSPYVLDTVNNKNKSLVLFFLALVSELKKMGTVPSIDIEKYLENI